MPGQAVSAQHRQARSALQKLPSVSADSAAAGGGLRATTKRGSAAMCTIPSAFTLLR